MLTNAGNAFFTVQASVKPRFLVRTVEFWLCDSQTASSTLFAWSRIERHLW